MSFKGVFFPRKQGRGGPPLTQIDTIYIISAPGQSQKKSPLQKKSLTQIVAKRQALLQHVRAKHPAGGGPGGFIFDLDRGVWAATLLPVQIRQKVTAVTARTAFGKEGHSGLLNVLH